MSQVKFLLPSARGICGALLKALFSISVALSLTFAYAGTASAAKPAGIVVDARTGDIMWSEDPDGLRYPASLTKMMTLYLVFDALESGRISLNSRVPVSKHAAAQAPSKLGVRAGQTFTVEQGIQALVTRSANDCATAFAEFLGGSEPRFGKMMTLKARQLGMMRTVYYNANGLPDARQVTTARDQARLGVALRKHFPQYYSYFSTRSFKYGKQVIGNHNRLIGKVRGVDGIKTGFTRAAGFNLVTSAQYDGRSVVGVVLGGTSGGQRDAKMRKLVETYLPRATRRGGDPDAFVASAKPRQQQSYETAYADTETRSDAEASIGAATRELSLPHKGPVPEARYDAAAAEQSIESEAINTVPVIRTKTVKIKKVASLDAMSAVETPVAVAQPEETETRSMAKVEPAAKVDTVTTASTEASNKGWVIQVGTSSAQEQARAILQNVQEKGGKVLRSATPFTVAFSKGNDQIYRARFGGFSDQDEAVRACKVLKKKGVSCWASLQ